MACVQLSFHLCHVVGNVRTLWRQTDRQIGRHTCTCVEEHRARCYGHPPSELALNGYTDMPTLQPPMGSMMIHVGLKHGCNLEWQTCLDTRPSPLLILYTGSDTCDKVAWW